jgi:hypothetical protein
VAAVKPNAIATATASTDAITDVIPLMPHAQGMPTG